MHRERVGVVIGVALVFSLISASAFARESATQDLFLRHHEVAANIGLFSALGHGGVTYAVSPVPWLAVEVGAGYGFTGAQFSGMVKPSLALGQGPHRLLLGGLGVSVGVWSKQTDVWDYWTDEDETYLWLNADIAGYTRRFASGLSFTVAGGVAIGLDGQYDSCVDGCSPDTAETIRGLVLPQLRAALGYTF